MRITLLSLAAALLLSLPGAVFAERIAGRIVGVSDGDTLKLLTSENREIKIRLAQIDAPEKAQAFGAASKESLSRLAFGRDAVAQCDTQDQYSRYVCTVYVGQLDVNREQLRTGYAWVYTQYAKKSELSRLMQLQQQAQSSQLGLWQDRSPVEPWLFRRGQN